MDKSKVSTSLVRIIIKMEGVHGYIGGIEFKVNYIENSQILLSPSKIMNNACNWRYFSFSE